MRHRVVREVGDRVDRAQRLQRALHRRRGVKHGSQHDEAQRGRVKQCAEVTGHGEVLG